VENHFGAINRSICRLISAILFAGNFYVLHNTFLDIAALMGCQYLIRTQNMLFWRAGGAGAQSAGAHKAGCGALGTMHIAPSNIVFLNSLSFEGF